MQLPSSPTHLSLGHLWGLSCVADHVRSWGWRPRNANPPPRLRKVPFLPAQNENNKEPSVAAASGAQRTHQNTSKSRSLPLARSLSPIHPCVTPLPSNTQSPRFVDPPFNQRRKLMGFVSRLVPPLLIGHSQFVKVKAKQGPSWSRFFIRIILCTAPVCAT